MARPNPGHPQPLEENGTREPAAGKSAGPREELSSALHRNARFPRGPSESASAFTSCGSILKTTGPALRDLAGR